MPNLNKAALGKILVLSVPLIAVIAGAFLWKRERRPLGEAPAAGHSPSESSQSARQEFLDGSFRLVKEVETLPGPVRNALAQQGDPRSVMANPGNPFEATDVISNPSLPPKRLIFAGVSENRWFVHYEQGGRAHSYVLALFNLAPSGRITSTWRGYCSGPAANINDLRTWVASGNCH